MRVKIDPQDLRENYQKMGAKHFADKYGTTIAAARTKASQLGVARKIDWNAKKETIIKSYLNGDTIEQIAAKEGHSCVSIKSRLTEWKVKIRVKGELAKIHSFDEDYFQKIDSEAKAYWLGFIYADGYVSSSSGRTRFEIKLAPVDEAHLIRIKLALRSTHPVFARKRAVGFGISSKRLVEQLGIQGVHPRKSLSLTFPSLNQVSKGLLRHFIRGYFDGDGSITINSNGRRWGFKMISTPEFLEGVMRAFVENGISETKLSIVKKVKNDRMADLGYGGYIAFLEHDKSTAGQNAYLIYEYLYRNSTIWLSRKRDKFESLLCVLSSIPSKLNRRKNRSAIK